jgi:hypothetical protein
VPYEIPNYPDDAIIEDWTIVGEGSHGQVRRVRMRQGDDPAITACIKLFTEEWYDAYQRELDAYTLMIHRGVKRCIPQVWYKRSWPRWKWDGKQHGDYHGYDRNEILHGLVMEFFEDCRQLDLKKADLRLADALAESLERIHEAGVVHNDIEERNILLVRESGTVRVVWVDFSCAWSGPEYKGPNPLEWDDFCSLLIDNMVAFLLPVPANGRIAGFSRMRLSIPSFLGGRTQRMEILFPQLLRLRKYLKRLRHCSPEQNHLFIYDSRTEHSLASK